VPTRAPNVSLRALSIRHYRSIKSAHFDPCEGLSVLIGPNGSGKTNLLEGMRLLRGEIARPRAERPASRSSRCTVLATYSVGHKSVDYRASFILASNERNQDQVVEAQEAWNLKAVDGKDEWILLPREFLDRKYREYYFLQSREGRRIYHSRRWSGKSSLSQDGLRTLEAVVSFTKSISYYSASQFTNPSRSPSSFEMEEGDRVMETYSDKGPHLTFISGLYLTYKKNRHIYRSYIDLVGPRGIGLIDGIEWKPIVLSTSSVDVKTGGRVVRKRKRRVLIVPVVSLRRSRLSFSQLSEGTFRTLALIFYLLTDESRLLLIEEPEVCVHHGLMRSLIEAIKAYSSRKQIVISTHSELVLDCVDPENVFAVTNRSVAGTVVKPLSSVMSNKSFAAMRNYLATSGTLGEYWTHGGLD
jgi:predicted ATPase